MNIYVSLLSLYKSVTVTHFLKSTNKGYLILSYLILIDPFVSIIKKYNIRLETNNKHEVKVNEKPKLH